MKFKLFIVLLLMYIITFSQNDPNKSKLPEYSPVSPEAFKLGTYGNVPVNLSTGKVNYKVPFYTIKVNNYEFPIFMNYNYSGLLVNDAPSSVGIGWSLNDGGVLIRERRGKNDYGTNGYQSNYRDTGKKVGKDLVIPILNSDYDEDDLNIIKYNLINNRIDGMPDKYVLNANNVSATFYFNEDNEIVFTPKKNYTVERFASGSIETYILTDDQGIKYSFGNNYIEFTYMDALSTNTAYYLFKIEFPNSDYEINFEYQSYEYSDKIYNEHITKPTSGTPPILPSCTYANNSETSTVPFVSVAESLHQSHLLSKITFPSGEIIFERDRFSSSLNQNIQKLISSIYINDYDENEIMEYNFLYANENDLFLKEIKKVTNSNTLDYYTFEYHHLQDIPNNLFDYEINNNQKKQDFYGFFNNKSPPNSNYGMTIKGGISHRLPSFQHTSLGVLTKIIYPTGGFTEIEYDSNKVTRGNFPNQFLNDNDCNDFFNTTTEGTFRADLFGSDVENQEITILDFQNETENIMAKFNLNYIIDQDSFNGSLIFRNTTIDEFDPKIIYHYNTINLEDSFFCNPLSYGDINNPFNFQINLEINQENGESIDKQEEFYIELPPGEYEIIVQRFGNLGDNDQMIIKVETMKNEEYLQALNDFENTPIEIGGIRVSKTKDCTNNDINCMEKEYKYLTDSNVSSGILLKDLIFKRTYDYLIYSICSDDGVNEISIYNYTDWYSSNRNPFANFDGNHMLYKRVEILSENNILGKEIKYFSGSYLGGSVFPYTPTSSTNYKIGREYQGQLYSQTGNLIRNNSTVYQDIKFSTYNSGTFNSIPGRVIGINSGAIKPGAHASGSFFGGLTLNNPFLAQYIGYNPVSVNWFEDISHDYLPIETHKIEYYNSNQLETTTNYTYDDETGYLKTSETSLNNNETQKVELTYPYEKTDAISIVMAQKNMISTPIETKNYEIVNGGAPKLLSTQKTIYDEFGANNLLLPNIIQTSKGESDPENRIIYHNYDNYGNPTEISKESGVHIVYIWGYNHTQPVAKIENVFLGDLPNTMLSDIYTASSATGNETTLLQKLNILRSHVNSLSRNTMITTFTYKPLIGVSTITDPKGDIQTFHYDTFNRLQFVKDQEGNILKENQYHYRQ